MAPPPSEPYSDSRQAQRHPTPPQANCPRDSPTGGDCIYLKTPPDRMPPGWRMPATTSSHHQQTQPQHQALNHRHRMLALTRHPHHSSWYSSDGRNQVFAMTSTTGPPAKTQMRTTSMLGRSAVYILQLHRSRLLTRHHPAIRPCTLLLPSATTSLLASADSASRFPLPIHHVPCYPFSCTTLSVCRPDLPCSDPSKPCAGRKKCGIAAASRHCGTINSCATGFCRSSLSGRTR